MQTPSRRLSIRLALWLAVLISVALVSLGGCGSAAQTVGSSGTAAPTTGASTPTSGPVALPTLAGGPACDTTHLQLRYVGESYASGHLGFGLSVHDGLSSPCQLSGYPQLSLYDAHGNSVTVATQQATTAPTFQAPAPQPVLLQPAQDSYGYFALDWATTASAGNPCAEISSVTLTNTGADSNSPVSFAPCGPISLSPYTATAPTSPGTAAASSLPTCQTSGLAIAMLQSQGAAGTDFEPYQITNTTTNACTLNGYPTIQFYNQQGQALSTQESKVADRPVLAQTIPVQTVVLPPRVSAYFEIVSHGPLGNGADTCLNNVASITVTPPGNSAGLHTSFPVAQICNGVDITPLTPYL